MKSPGELDTILSISIGAELIELINYLEVGIKAPAVHVLGV